MMRDPGAWVYIARIEFEHLNKFAHHNMSGLPCAAGVMSLERLIACDGYFEILCDHSAASIVIGFVICRVVSYV
jgi:hypothetical protein